MVPALTVRAAATWLPETRYPAAQAIVDGRLDPDDARRLGVRELPVSADPAPDMAISAAGRALDAARCSPTEVGLLVHAWIHHQGHDFWSPAHYLADRLGAARALPFGVQQMCNGGAVAVQLAAAWLTAEPELGTALVTTADRFAEPGFDRWRGDYGVVYGDGATAVLLSGTGDGPLRLLSTGTSAAADLEVVHRGQDRFSPAPGWHNRTVDVRRTKKAFLAEHGPDRLARATVRHVEAALGRALGTAAVAPDDPRLRLVTLPRLGRTALDNAYRPALSALRHAEVVDLGPDTGHLGAGDAVAALAAIVDDALLRPGELACVVSGGGGFTWSCLLVQAV